MPSAVRPIAVVAGLVLVLSATATAFAADGVPAVDVSGVVLDTEGQPAVVESARVDEFETPESEGVRTEIDVAADGTAKRLSRSGFGGVRRPKRSLKIRTSPG